jgi:iron complex transport system permease protein
LSVLGLFIGSTGFEWLGHHPVVWQIRLPRTLGTWLAGALLGLAGAIAQGVLRNPLADPYLLGSASGAALAFVIGLVAIDTNPWLRGILIKVGFTGLAFIGASLAVLLTLFLSYGLFWFKFATATGSRETLRLLLSGLIVGIVLGAVTALLGVQYPHVLPVLQSFTLGNTSFLSYHSCILMGGILSLVFLVAWWYSPALTVLSIGEATTESLGLGVRKVKLTLLLVLAFATAGAVAQTGLIAFIGLAAPHMVRVICCGKQNMVLLLSSLMGGVLLLIADIAARWIAAPQELPIGVFTAIFGGLYLLYLLARGKI